MAEDVSLVVQAGGASKRMGEDKGRKIFLGRPLVERVLERLGPIATEVMITTNRPLDYAFTGRCLVPDLLPGRGALGGLYTALNSALFPIVALVACDMPFASLALFKEAVSVMVREQVDVVIPRSQDGLEPLHAVYRRSTCLKPVQQALELGNNKMIAWFPEVKVRELSMAEVERIDPNGLAFRNVNTPEEFMEAERLAQRELEQGSFQTSTE